MRTTLITLHGAFVDHEGKRSTDMFHPYAKALGIENIIDIDYGYTNSLLSKWRNPSVVKRLLRLIEGYESTTDEFIILGHSNGCAIMHQASFELNKIRKPIKYIYINPALDNHLSPANSIKLIHVWCSKDDKVVFWADKLRMLTFGYFTPKQWGEMGNTGYIGPNKRFLNIYLKPAYHEMTSEYYTFLHSSIFDPPDSAALSPMSVLGATVLKKAMYQK